MTIITRENFTAAMEAAVAERGPDFVYDRTEPGWSTPDRFSEEPTCVYQTPDGTPACIIGLTLYKIDPALVPAHNDDDSAAAVLKALGAPKEVQWAANAAQRAQDERLNWGAARRAYLDYLAYEDEKRSNA